MRCCSRSTASFSSATAGVVLSSVLVVLGTATVAGEPARGVEVQEAVADAVRERMGELTDVRVTLGQLRLADRPDAGEGVLEARPAPGARLARRTRFTLYRRPADGVGKPERVGYVVAEAHATLSHLRTARDLTRGTVLTADDLVVAEAEVGAVLLKPLPELDDVVGATVVRHMTEGALVTNKTVRPPTLVRTGDLVLTRARVGTVVAAGRTTAAQSGQLGDVIRLVNEQSGRKLRGRIVALGEVEVVH